MDRPCFDGSPIEDPLISLMVSIRISEISNLWSPMACISPCFRLEGQPRGGGSHMSKAEQLVPHLLLGLDSPGSLWRSLYPAPREMS